MFLERKYGKFRARIHLGTKLNRSQKSAGLFSNEIAAALAVNELCKYFGVPIKNSLDEYPELVNYEIEKIGKVSKIFF